MTLGDVVWGLNFLIGLCFAGWIVHRTDWFHTRSAVIGAVLAGAMLFLWLPIIVVVTAFIVWALHQKHLFIERRERASMRRRIAGMMALKDKHGIDDAAVTAEVIDRIKVKRT